MARDQSRPNLTSEWRVDVTDEDIRMAKLAWLAACDGGADPARVATLHTSYERLVRTQGRQLSEALQRRRPAAPTS